jgi:hypothetical protein
LVNGVKILEVLFIVDGPNKVDVLEDLEAVLDSQLEILGEGVWHEFAMD